MINRNVLYNDEWQVSVHFLQALLVSPKVVYSELVPKICHTLFLSCCKGNEKKISHSKRRSKSASLVDFDEDEVNEVMKWIGKEYKARLMYYQIMSCGNMTKKQDIDKGSAFFDDESENIWNQKSQTSQFSNSCNPMDEKLDNLSVHILACNKNNDNEELYEGNAYPLCNTTDADMERNSFGETLRSSSIRCLRDILLESDSDILLETDDNSSVDESFSEEYLEECEQALSVFFVVAELSRFPADRVFGFLRYAKPSIWI
ncbi:hypothetical protein Leryth_020902 [Lithospermum erythrorhizon]|nr:hypothetical protein Leryth_020902 [Lithospermum erythrorhizon]